MEKTLYKLHEKDLKVFIQPQVFILHQGSATGDKIYSKDKKSEVWNRNWQQFLKKWNKYEDYILDNVDGLQGQDSYHH